MQICIAAGAGMHIGICACCNCSTMSCCINHCDAARGCSLTGLGACRGALYSSDRRRAPVLGVCVRQRPQPVHRLGFCLWVPMHHVHAPDIACAHMYGVLPP
jgi:hypothetical protein